MLPRFRNGCHRTSAHSRQTPAAGGTRGTFLRSCACSCSSSFFGCQVNQIRMQTLRYKHRDQHVRVPPRP
eukprot:763050-Hanusia_phi.AAC.1